MDREKLIKSHMDYAKNLAKKIKYSLPDYIPFEDLVGWAYVGLVDAANKYNYNLGVSFKTYSYYRIKGAIYDGLREFSWHKPSHYAKYKFNKASNDLEKESLLKMKKGLKKTPEIEDLKSLVFKFVSVHLISLDSSYEKYGHEIKSDETPETKFEIEEAKKIVEELMKNLNEEEKLLIKLYYYKDLSMEEVGQKMGYSKTWVSRKHNSIIKRLKDIWFSNKQNSKNDRIKI